MPFDTAPRTCLLLDLDETSFIALTESEFNLYGESSDLIKKFKKIHVSHVLSNYIKNSGYYFYVINPEKLKAMIEGIYKQGNEIVIFTSGFWLSPALLIISQLCDLSAEVATQFNKSLFLNPQHDGEKLGFSLKSTQMLPKAYRLHGLFGSVPQLRRKRFILLDNEVEHVSSCSVCPYLEGVRATTNTEEMSFYETVLQTMKLAGLRAGGLSPSTLRYCYPEKILKAFIQLMQTELDESQNIIQIDQAPASAS